MSSQRSISKSTSQQEKVYKGTITTLVKTPIALFAFKRPRETLLTLESLAKNRGAKSHPLYIFCDGPRRPDEKAGVEETRKIVRSQKWTERVSVIEKEKNQGLANSIITGVNQLCEEYGRAIVIEDDLLLSEGCLEYFDKSLGKYQSEDQVMQISGHRFYDRRETEDESSFFIPLTTSWGWATWSRAWKHFDPNMTGNEVLRSDMAMRKRFNLNDSYPFASMVEDQKAGKVDSWAICWVWSMFKRNGLTLYPTKTLVKNIGFSTNSQHTKSELPWMRSPDWHPSNQVANYPDEIKIDEERFMRNKRLFRVNNYPSLYWRIIRRIQRVVSQKKSD